MNRYQYTYSVPAQSSGKSSFLQASQVPLRFMDCQPWISQGFTPLAFKVWVRIECTSLGYVLAKEKQSTVALDMQRRELDLQLSVLKRADTLSKKAHTKLGLVALNPKQARKIIY